MPARHLRLYVNIDHVATLRQARRGDEPSPAEAAILCEKAGADGITAHLREDRRHIQDSDIDELSRIVTTCFNLEAACADEMIRIAIRAKPQQVTLVPEKREEITTEGGLDVFREESRVRAAIDRLTDAGIRTSLFIDPSAEAVEQSLSLGADAVELHTGEYARNPATIDALHKAARVGASIGIAVHAGHGLTVNNVGPVAAIPEIEELNIGHSIVSRAIFVGLEEAVREVRRAMDAARL